MRKASLIAGVALAAGLGAGVAQAEIVIGVAGPMTGDYAAFGNQFQRGAVTAVEELNAKGGVLGEQIRLIVGDDVCDPKQATAVANQMVSEGAVFVAGHFCSSSTIPASAVYAEEGILEITMASTNPAVTEDLYAKGVTTIFRTCGRDDQQGSVAGTWMAENYMGKNVAVLHDKSTGGKGYADIARDTMNKLGLKEVMYEGFTTGEMDYSALVSKLKLAKVEAIIMGGYYTDVSLIARQSHDQGYYPQFIGNDSLNTQEVATIAGDAANGIMFTNAADPRNMPNAQAAAEKIRAGGYEPEGYTLTTYATVMLWADAVTEAGTTDAEVVAQTLRKHPWESIIGTFEYDEKGDLKDAGYVWYQFKNGTYSQM